MLFGCEHWAPWSEELGRKPVLQASLFLVNMWQLHVALAPNFASIMVGRSLGDLSSARGSVTLGMIADMWESDNQQYAGPLSSSPQLVDPFKGRLSVVLLSNSLIDAGISGYNSPSEVSFRFYISSASQRPGLPL